MMKGHFQPLKLVACGTSTTDAFELSVKNIPPLTSFFRIEPYPDSSLNVEWYRNDKPLPFGNRWRTSYDFGFAALDIIGSYAEDSGRYTLRAKNILGSAESHIDVKISRKKTFLYRLGLPREVRNCWFKRSSKRKVGFRP